MTTRIYTKLDMKRSIFEVSFYGLPPAVARYLKSLVEKEIESIMKSYVEENRSLEYECRTVRVSGSEYVSRIRCESE